jgi:hypothetical protein
MPLLSIAAGDEVAILPNSVSPPEETLEIATVAFANLHLVRLIDHRMYSRYDRSGLTPRSPGYIQLATAQHRAALNRSKETESGD